MLRYCNPLMYTAHSRQRFGRPAAAVATAGGLLAVCVALAAWLVSARGLADPVQVPGWAISFQPPRGWSGQDLEADPFGESVRFREPASSGRGRELIVTHSSNPRNLSPGDICAAIARQVSGAPLVPWRHRLEVASLGQLRGARVLMPRGALIHVGVLVLPDGQSEAYILTLVARSPLNEQDVRLGEALARAVRLTAN